MDLSGAHLMDGQHVLSQEHLNVAQDIAHRYENLRLIWIPPSDRTPGGDSQPFAIKDIRSGLIIKTFKEDFVHLIPNWLWANDSQRVDTYGQFMAEKEAADRARKAAQVEANAPAVDLLATVLHSNKHTFTHDGVRYSDSGIERIK